MSRAQSDTCSRTGAGEVWIELPRGLSCRDGVRRRWVRMRPATGLDEIRALSDFRVLLRPESFAAILLARVITALSSAPPIEKGGRRDVESEEAAPVTDLALLEELDDVDRSTLEIAYRRLNEYELSGVAS